MDEKAVGEAIDPHFSDLYSNGKKEVSSSSQELSEESESNNIPNKIKEESADGMNKICDILAKDLYGLVERSIKIVDFCETAKYSSPDGGIKLFTDSGLLSSSEMIIQMKTKVFQQPFSRIRKNTHKNRVKNDVKPKLEDVAVSADWLFKHSKIYNS